jgi:hypothetical protein
MSFGAKVQSASGTTSATFGGAPVAGNLLVFMAASTASVTFTAPSGWNGGTAVSASGGSARGMQMSWKISAGTETGAISPASGSPTNCVMVEYQGPFDVSPLDVENCQLTVSGTVHTSPTVTATATKPPGLIVGGCAVDATGRTWSTEDVNSSTSGVVEDVDATWVLFSKAVTALAAANYTIDATVSGAAVIGEAGIMVFKGLFNADLICHRQSEGQRARLRR